MSKISGAIAALSVAALIAGAGGVTPQATQTQVYGAADVALAGSSQVTVSKTDKVLMIDGTNLRAFKPSPIEQAFGGLFADFDYEIVNYPRKATVSSEKKGAANLLLAINQTDGKMIVFGFSQGAKVGSRVRKQLVKDRDLSRVNDITFIEYGTPRFLYTPDSPFQVLRVAYEYDGVAIWPNPFNFLAMQNALTGAMKFHPQDYANADINRDAKWIKQVGNVTLVVLHSDHLALTPSWLVGTPLGDAIEAFLRPGIDRAYRWEKNGFVRVTGPILEVADTSQVVGQATAQFVDADPVSGESSTDVPEPQIRAVSQKPVVDSTPSPVEFEQQLIADEDVKPEATKQVVDDDQDVTPTPEPEPSLDKVELSEDDSKLAPGKDGKESDDSDDTVSPDKVVLSKKESAKESDEDSGTKSERAERRSAKHELKRERVSTTASPGSTDSDD